MTAEAEPIPGKVQRAEAVRRLTGMLGDPDVAGARRLDVQRALRILETDAKPIPQGKPKQ